MLFLKRCSDVFDAEREKFLQTEVAAALKFGELREKAEKDAEQEAKNPKNYSGFFVPERARWNYLLFELHTNVGDGLNKAKDALEEENLSMLDGVLQHIDFCKKVGKSPLPDIKLRKLITHRYVRQVRGDPRLLCRRAAGRDQISCQRLFAEHPPLRRQLAAAGTTRRARPFARRRAESRSGRPCAAVRRARY